MPTLTNIKYETLAQGIAAGKNNTQSYIDAGFSPKGANAAVTRLLKHREEITRRIKEIIEEQQKIKENELKQAAKELAVDKKWIIAQLVENVEMAKSAKPVYDNKGNATGEYQVNLQAANKALELIGKELGMFVDRKEVRTGPLNNLTDEEIDRIIASLDAELPAEVVKAFSSAGEKSADQRASAEVLPSIH